MSGVRRSGSSRSSFIFIDTLGSRLKRDLIIVLLSNRCSDRTSAYFSVNYLDEFFWVSKNWHFTFSSGVMKT